MTWIRGGKAEREGKICVVPTLPAQVLCEAGKIWGDDDGWIGGGRFAVECSAVGMIQLLYCCWLGWSRGGGRWWSCVGGGKALLDYRYRSRVA